MNELTVREIAERVDPLFARWDHLDMPGCALGIVRGGELMYARGYGMSNLEHGVPITPSSIFHVASISKQFTSMCIALLHLEGRLDLDDDIRRFVPEIPDYGPTITIRHLVHHTSGLRDQWDLLALAGWREDDPITEGDVLEIAARQTALNFQPGDEYLYSNTGYTLLSVIVRRASGLSLREFAAERIFKPLGMSRTHFHDDHAEIVRGRTQAYDRHAGGVLHISIPVFDLCGTTSLFTTVEDLARWSENFVHQRVGGEAAFALTLVPATLNNGVTIDYAFGLQHRTRAGDGLRIIEHSGADAGYRAHFMMVPEQHLAISCLANVPDVLPGVRAEEVLDALLAAAPAAPVTVTIDTPVERYAGVFRDPRNGEALRFTAGDGVLSLAMYGGVPLTRHAEREFIMPFSPTTIYAFDPQAGVLEIRPASGVVRRLESMPAVDPTQQLDEYAGAYTSDELGTTWTLAPADSGLVLRRRKFEGEPLAPGWADTFFGNSTRLEFTRVTAGRVDGFSVNTSRVRGVRFKRA